MLVRPAAEAEPDYPHVTRGGRVVRLGGGVGDEPIPQCFQGRGRFEIVGGLVGDSEHFGDYFGEHFSR
jgi:hypothetical protein